MTYLDASLLPVPPLVALPVFGCSAGVTAVGRDSGNTGRDPGGTADASFTLFQIHRRRSRVDLS